MLSSVHTEGILLVRQRDQIGCYCSRLVLSDCDKSQLLRNLVGQKDTFARQLQVGVGTS